MAVLFDPRIHVVVPHNSLATYGAQGVAPPAPNFDAAGYNNAFYAWKSGSCDAGYWNSAATASIVMNTSATGVAIPTMIR